MKQKLLALSMAMLLLAGCSGPKAETTPSPAPAENPQPTQAPVETELHEDVSFAVLKGPSGVGAAKLIADSEAGETWNNYQASTFAGNDEVVAGLTNGSIDIAAMASNVAATLYNKTGGDIQAIAVSGLGVLYLLENGDAVQSMSDLRGRTLYATGQGANPEYVLNYLLTQNGVEPAEVDIQWRTADEISTLMASGDATLCMLPVPAATGVLLKNPDVREALDLSAEWDALDNGSRLTMTTIVARTAFLEEHPEAADTFLNEYAASVEFVNGDPAGAAELVAKYEITPNAKIAEAAIPKCALVCITGVEEMKAALAGYYQVLFAANPAAVGGEVPGDGFYYGG